MTIVRRIARTTIARAPRASGIGVVRRSVGARWIVRGILTTGGLVACGGDADPASSTVTVDTVGGIEAVTNAGDAGHAIGWTVGAPRIELGHLEGEGAYVFGSIGGIVVDDAGRVFVGDADVLEIRVFSPDGGHLFTFGRKGQGPGEFENIDAMRLAPDGSLLVRDVRQARVSVFGLDGEFRRQVPLERPWMQFQNRPTLWADTAGRLYDWVRFAAGDVDSLGVVVYSDSGTVRQRVVTAAFSPLTIDLLRDGQPFATLPVPHTAFASGAVAPSGWIVSGVGTSYELEVRAADGSLQRRIRREIEPTPRPAWLADTTEARIAEFIDELGGGRPEDYELPEHLPAFTHIAVDDLDHIWVGRDGDQSRLPTTFDVFGPAGRFMGQVELPPLRLMHIGRDFIAGISYDELDVERAVVLSLMR